MSHHTGWDNEARTVILMQYDKGAIKDDLYIMAKENAALMASVEHTVHLIIDETNIQLNLNSADMRYLERNVPPNQGHIALIPHPSSLMFKKIIVNMGNTIAPKAFDGIYYCRSVEEARELLQKEFNVKYP
jgi:hypothetical protein